MGTLVFDFYIISILPTCCIISWIQRSRLYSFNQGFYNSFIALISFIFCFSYLRDYILELKCIKSLILSWKFRNSAINIKKCMHVPMWYLARKLSSVARLQIYGNFLRVLINNIYTWRISNDFGVDNKDEHKSDCSTI